MYFWNLFSVDFVPFGASLIDFGPKSDIPDSHIVFPVDKSPAQPKVPDLVEGQSASISCTSVVEAEGGSVYLMYRQPGTTKFKKLKNELVTSQVVDQCRSEVTTRYNFTVEMLFNSSSFKCNTLNPKSKSDPEPIVVIPGK